MKTECYTERTNGFLVNTTFILLSFLRSALPKTCFRTVTTPVLDQTGNNLRTPMPHDVEKVRMH